jgi:hypothetical protein
VKHYLFVLVVILLLAGSFWRGLEAGEAKWSGAVAEATKKRNLSDLRGCLFAVDSTAIRLVRILNAEGLQKVAWRVAQCDGFLETLGTTGEDEEIGRILGEARLFYDGYSVTLNEIIGRQIQLETLYNAFGSVEKMRKAQELEAQQTRQIHEAQQFLDRLEMLIVRSW